MTIFKSSIILTFLLSSCFSASAELSSKQKNLLQCTAQTAGCVINTAAAGYVALKHLDGIKKYGIKKYFYDKDTWHSIEHIIMYPGVVACFSYLAYRLGKNAHKSYIKAFYPKKSSENTTLDENNINATESTVVNDKNQQEKIVS